MPSLLIVVLLYGFSAMQPLRAEVDDMELVAKFQASTHVFYGTVVRILPERNYETGLMGVYLKEVNRTELTLEPITWGNAKAFSFEVKENYKVPLKAGTEAMLPDQDPDIWTHVEDALGDAFLAQPPRPDVLLLSMQPGDAGLFFIRYQVGSTTPLLYRAEIGKQAGASRRLLQRYMANPNLSLTQVVEQARMEKDAAAAREAAAFKVFEDEYYKILRGRDLEIRRSLLKDLIVRMGFEGRWEYYDFKERYLREHGEHLSDSEIPSGPTEGREKLWHDISGELEKIDVILKARR